MTNPHDAFFGDIAAQGIAREFLREAAGQNSLEASHFQTAVSRAQEAAAAAGSFDKANTYNTVATGLNILATEFSNKENNDGFVSHEFAKFILDPH